MLELRGVTKRYTGIPVASGVSFTAAAGEVTGYLGPNGSGKSTTLKMITGLIEPSEGEVLFNGVPISRSRGLTAGVIPRHVPAQAPILPMIFTSCCAPRGLRRHAILVGHSFGGFNVRVSPIVTAMKLPAWCWSIQPMNSTSRCPTLANISFHFDVGRLLVGETGQPEGHLSNHDWSLINSVEFQEKSFEATL